jgi:NAD(P)-dependent dehydrogenase (short-subunit alcohol dehydrogenase family)
MVIEDSIAVVTGATGGIGFAVAKKLVMREIGAVAIVDKSDRCKQSADEIGAVAIVDKSDRCKQSADHLNEIVGADRAVPFQGDVTDSEFRRGVFSQIAERFGPVRICVPAAGMTLDSLAVKVNRDSGQTELYPEAEFRRLMDLNLLHPAYWAMETIGGIAQQRYSDGLEKWAPHEGLQGAVILIGSVSSKGNRGQVSYAAAKSGLVGVTSTLNLEGLFHGVLTKIIHPGFVDTPMVDKIDNDYFEQNLKPNIGLGRKISPEEIGEIICCMIENDVISGEVWADASMTPLA